MKRWLYPIICLLFCAAAACTAPGGEPLAALLPPSPTPAPTPVPTPQPVVAILADSGKRLFYEGLTADKAGDNAKLMRAEGGVETLQGSDFEGEYAVIAYLDGSDSQREALERLRLSGVPVCAYAPNGETPPEGVPTLAYDPLGAAEKALDEAIGFAPHDTPVRLTALFTSEESAAFAAFSQGIAGGKVMRKGVYIENVTETPLEEWIIERMHETLPGTIDGVYAETAGQALLAASAIEGAGLSGVEVFCAEATDALLNRMLAVPDILVSAVGTNDAFAGRYLRAQATRLLLGLPGASDGAALLPRLYRADTLANDWASLSEES